MEVYGLPPIGQKQRRPMDGAQFHTLWVGEAGGVAGYNGRAERLKIICSSTFYNPAKGVLAGWKSADGKLHDYYSLFVNGVAVTYGLGTRDRGNKIWHKPRSKMKDVG